MGASLSHTHVGGASAAAATAAATSAPTPSLPLSSGQPISSTPATTATATEGDEEEESATATAAVGDVPLQLRSSLTALSLDWAVVDSEMNEITVRLVASLLTSRLRSSSPRGGTGAAALPLDLPDEDGDGADDDGAAATAAVGAHELYVSAALRLAALQLGREGVQRLVLALAYIVNGGETQEERAMRRTSSAATTATRLTTHSSPELHHFQRGAGFTGSTGSATTTAGGGGGSTAMQWFSPTTAGSPTTTITTAAAAITSPHAGSLGVVASRKFSSAPQPPAPGHAAAISVPTSARTPLRGGGVGAASLDQLALTLPGPRGAGGGSHHQQQQQQYYSHHHHQHPPRTPPAHGGDDALSAIGGRTGAAGLLPPHCRARTTSPLLHSGLGADLASLSQPRRRSGSSSSSISFSCEDRYYNNGLLRSMNARSTPVSTVRAGATGELLRSDTSITTIMSLSTAPGALGGGGGGGGGLRTPRGDPMSSAYSGNSSIYSVGRSPMVASLFTATQRLVPPAPGASGLPSPTRSAQHSMSSLSAFPGTADARWHSHFYSRRSGGAHSSRPVARAVAAAVWGGRAYGGYAQGDEPAVATAGVPCHLPPAIGGGVVVAGEPLSTASSPMAAGVPPAACRDTALRSLAPAAVLTALATTLAHLHLSHSDVTNFVTMLVVAVWEVQVEARIGGAGGGGGDASSPSPVLLGSPASVADVRAAVQECLRPGFLPFYAHTRRVLCAATAAAVQTVTPPSAPPQPASASSSPRRDGAERGGASLWPSAPMKKRGMSVTFTAATCASAPTTPCTNAGEPRTRCGAVSDLPARAQALHDHFAAYLTIEGAPPPREATLTAAATRTARAPVSQQRSGNVRPPPVTPPASASAAPSGPALCMHSCCSDSVTGASLSASLSHSTNTDTATATSGQAASPRVLSPACPPSAHATAPTQAEVRCASHFLLKHESVFVLHSAEVVHDVVGAGAGDYANTTPRRRELRAGGGGDGVGGGGGGGRCSSFSSAGVAGHTTAPTSTPCHRRDSVPDIFVQLSAGSATVWPLRTRLLVRRHDYAYVYDAVASTMALLREESLYVHRPAAAESGRTGTPQPQSHALHPHTPIAVMDLQKAAAEPAVLGVQVLSGPGDVEVVSLMPSRVSRGTLHERGRQSPGVAGAATMDEADGATAAVLTACWTDADTHDEEVYRMKSRTGAMYLLALPADGESESGAAAAATAASAGADAAQASVAHAFTRNRLVRPAVLSLASPVAKATTAGARGGHGDDVLGRNSPTVQCDLGDGARHELALDLGSEPTRIAAYPLRLLCGGVLHHFFFANPSTRDQWYQTLVQLTSMTQSSAQMEMVAAAPHDVERYLRQRLSLPAGPGAFDCLDMLGAGTFGRVLLVRHKLSRRLFAMKVIRKRGFHGVRNIVEARREKTLLDVLDCPFIMKIHCSFQTDSRVYMLFDYLPGAELLLHTQSAHGHRFDETTARFYIAELAIAVEHLRVRGIVHRDIKGDNLVLDSEGHVVLTDFGFAKNILVEPAEPSLTPQVLRQHTSCGTLAYIAPEVLSNSRRRAGYGLAVDWWSLGVVLFTFLTGYFPFLKPTGPETSHAIVHGSLHFPPRTSLSEEARHLLQQLLKKDPAARITTLADLQRHPFFEGFDWVACRERRLPPPVVLHKDSYRSPRTIADARQSLYDRVRRSLAWSAGKTSTPYEPPSHSRASTSGNGLAAKYQVPFEEEVAELRLVADAYGADAVPKPRSRLHDVFGPSFAQQERCGSDRDESDVEDLRIEDYSIGVAASATAALRRMKESCGAPREPLRSPTSTASLNSASHEYTSGTGLASDEDGRQPSPSITFSAPPFADFSERMYATVALAKYAGGVVGGLTSP
ncbi:Protein kinase domain/Protein tyrosine kinase/Kinase-like [Novymonas esmeraldas]|uniref:non-specific serine/threonine protein kinase n=1 Tax=Novymonas esmeraldas TaxID=1808958 RepID=A0AAW0ERK8_9TRYP